MHKGSIVLTSILFLALVGLISYVGNSPGKFLLNIFIVAVIAFVIFFIVRAVMNRGGGSGGGSDMQKYRKAVKQSKQKYSQAEKHPKRKSKQATTYKSRKKRRHQPHLTVIEGKKNANKEKNDRASN